MQLVPSSRMIVVAQSKSSEPTVCKKDIQIRKQTGVKKTYPANQSRQVSDCDDQAVVIITLSTENNWHRDAYIQCK